MSTDRPSSLEALVELALEHWRSHRRKAAIRLIERVLERMKHLSTKEKLSKMTVEELLELGYDRQRFGKSKAAIFYLSHAARRAPERTDIFIAMGKIRKRSNRSQAIADFTAALQLDAKSAEAYFERAMCYAYPKEGSERDKAIADLAEVVCLQPDYCGAWENLGKFRKDQGDLAGAIEAFDNIIIRLHGLKEGLDAHIQRGLCRMQTHDYANANDDFSAVIAVKDNLQHGDQVEKAYRHRSECNSLQGNLALSVKDSLAADELHEIMEELRNQGP